MQRHLIYGLAAGLLTAVLGVWVESAQGSIALAQVPGAPGAAAGSPTPTVQPRGSRVPAAEGAPASVTVEGCVAREQDVPGRKASAVERAGIADDFILIDAKVTQGTPPSEAKTTMFEIEGIEDHTLRSHVGKRVQLLGSFGKIDSGLVEIRASEVKEVAGRCP